MKLSEARTITDKIDPNCKNLTPEEVYAIATRAFATAQSRVRKGNISDHSTFEDGVQEAAVGVLRATRREGKVKDIKALAFTYGKNAALQYLFWWLYNKSRYEQPGYTVREIAEGDAVANGVGSTESPEQLDCIFSILFLARLFYRARTKRGKRGRKAAVRDALICIRVMQGFSQSQIERELGLSEGQVSWYRRKLRERLMVIKENPEVPLS